MNLIIKVLIPLLFFFNHLLFAQENEKITVQLNWKYQFSYAGFIAAKEKGFYKKAGLDVTLIEKNHSSLTQGLLDEEYDYLVTSSRFLHDKNLNKKIKFLANYLKQTPLALVAQKEFFTLEQLKGKKVMISQNSLQKDAIALMLDKFEMKPSDIQRVKHSYNIEDFINKRVDAMMIYTTNELYDLIHSNINYNVFSPQNFGLNAPDINLISTQNTYEKYKDRTMALVEATNKGWDYAIKHPLEMIDIIYEKYSQAKSKDALLYESKYIIPMLYGNIYPLGSIDVKFHKSFYDFLQQKKRININFDTVVYRPKKLEFSQKEKVWLSQNPELNVLYEKDTEPFIMYNKKTKQYEGLMIDYLSELTNQNGLRFNIVKKQNIPANKNMFAFIEIPSISIVNKKDNYLYHSYELRQKKIVTDSYVIYAHFKSENKDIDIIYEKEYGKAVSNIQNRKREVFLTNLISTKYWFKQNNNSKVKVHENDQYNIPYFVYFEKPLDEMGAKVLKYSLDKISQNKRLEIYSKWTLSNKEAPFDYTFVYEILGVILLVIGLVILWNINLKRKVSEKTKEINDLLKTMEQKVIDRTQNLNEVKEDLQKHLDSTMASIKYASLIQHSIMPSEKRIKSNFTDSFLIWKPKDIVGGDIYLFETLRNENESLLMVIDCTGHGVHGALVTMLVKAIEREIIGKIEASHKEVSPAAILNEFDEVLKVFLQQEGSAKVSNAGFDGGVLYYNKKENYIKYAGAKTPLFCVRNNEVEIYKSNRNSIGYNRNKSKVEFIDERIDIEQSGAFYLTTDGFLDQIGGTQSFPFGKKRFVELIQAHSSKAFSLQKELFLETLGQYKSEELQNDDMAMIGFRIDAVK